MMIWSFRENVFSHPFLSSHFFHMESGNFAPESLPGIHRSRNNLVANTVARIMSHYVPKEGDTMQAVADELGVVKDSLKNNLFIIPVGHLMQFDGQDVTVAHTNTSIRFPAVANGDLYGETRLAA